MENELADVFLNRLLHLMNARHIKQADICKLTGLSSSQVHHLVSGRTKSPALATACKIARALGVSLDYLGGLIDEPRPPRWARMPEYADARQARINEQYADMNERGKVRASESVDDIHANPKNRAGVSPEAAPVGGAVREAV